MRRGPVIWDEYSLKPWIHEAIVAAIVAATIACTEYEETVATTIASWLLELNMFNSSNRGGDSRSPVGRHFDRQYDRHYDRRDDRLVYSLHNSIIVNVAISDS